MEGRGGHGLELGFVFCAMVFGDVVEYRVERGFWEDDDALLLVLSELRSGEMGRL